MSGVDVAKAVAILGSHLGDAEETAMALAGTRYIAKSLDRPDETRSFEGDSGKLELVTLGEDVVGRATFKPGWRWSKNVKPIAGTESCQGAHVGYCVKGRMHVVMDSGDEHDYGPGDVSIIPPGHDAWIVGDEECVMIDWSGMGDYAKR